MVGLDRERLLQQPGRFVGVVVSKFHARHQHQGVSVSGIRRETFFQYRACPLEMAVINENGEAAVVSGKSENSEDNKTPKNDTLGNEHGCPSAANRNDWTGCWQEYTLTGYADHFV
jgi:hypothetical protein